MAQIEDGSGSSYLAKVDSKKRLYTKSVSIGENLEATKTGDSFNINTGVITLTDSVDTPVAYLKNNETKSLHIVAIAIGLGPSTGGSGGIPKVTVIRNPTTGTIISSTPTAVDISSNRNYGSAKALDSVLAYKGATGDTMTDGDDHLIIFQSAGSRLFATIDELLPTGSSIGVKVDPQPSNTSMDVYCAFICHLEEAE